MEIPAQHRQWLNAAAAAAQAGDLPQATALAREALAQGAQYPLLLNLRAYWHEQEGRYADALEDLQQAQTLAPGDAIILNALGLAYARLGRMGEAASAFHDAVVYNSEFAPAHFNKGWANEELGELDIARQCYARSIELAPSSPDSHARLAALAARLGEWTLARSSAEHALALDPRHPMAAIGLAGAEFAERNMKSAEARLCDVLKEPLGVDDRARAEGLLGDVWDAQGRTGAAFDAYSRRNRALRDAYRARFEGPGIETMSQYLRWLSAYFDQTAPWTPAAGEKTSMRHVFILGFARSGTTLLEEILAGNPGAATTQERDALQDGAREFMLAPEGVERLKSLSADHLQYYRDLYYSRIREFGIATDCNLLIDKQPFNTIKLPLIVKLFPDAKIIFCTRDPRDVVLSCFRRQFRLNPSTYEFLTLEGAAHLYSAIMHLAEHYQRKLPLNLLQLRYEDLLANFDSQMQTVCAFTGLEWSGTLRDFPANSGRRAIATPSAAQIKQGLIGNSAGRWRLYRDQLAPVLPILAPWVERFGYSPNVDGIASA